MQGLSEKKAPRPTHFHFDGDGGRLAADGADGSDGGPFLFRDHDHQDAVIFDPDRRRSCAPAANNNRNTPRISFRVGNHLRTIHPSPIGSDQVIVVPNMFVSEYGGSSEEDDDAYPSFADLRQELEPILRSKYKDSKFAGNPTLDSIRGDFILTANIWRRGGSGDVATAPLPKTATSLGQDVVGGGDDTTTNGAAALLKGVAQRVCQYFSIDPNTSLVNAGVRLGQPTPHNKARTAHSSHFGANIFVIATFGSPRALVLRHGANVFRLPLEPNSATGLMVDLTTQGWLYSIENLTVDEIRGQGLGGPEQQRLETITVFVSGTCTRMRRRAAAPSDPVANLPVPPPPPPPPPPVRRWPPSPPPSRRRRVSTPSSSDGGDLVGGHDSTAVSLDGSPFGDDGRRGEDGGLPDRRRHVPPRRRFSAGDGFRRPRGGGADPLSCHYFDVRSRSWEDVCVSRRGYGPSRDGDHRDPSPESQHRRRRHHRCDDDDDDDDDDDRHGQSRSRSRSASPRRHS